MARGIASVKVKEFETYLKKPPNFLSQREEAKIWEELKGCVTNNKGRVDDAFAKFEVAIKTKYQSYRLEMRREYKELKKSIIDASRTKKSAEALEISGQAPRNSPSPSSNQDNNSTSLLADGLCDLIQWLHDYITGVSIVTTPPIREEDQRLSDKHTVTYSKAWNKIIEIKDLTSKVTQKVTEKQVLSTDATVAVQADSRAIKNETSSSSTKGGHDSSATNGEQLGQGETIQKLREELRVQRMSFKKQQKLEVDLIRLQKDKDELKIMLSKMAKDKQSRKREARYEDTIRRLQEELREQRMSFEEKQQKWGEDMYRLQQDKDQIMTRMSKMSGDKLTQNNPKITDLSDPNRPQKLAEKFGELYDNEWTDVLDILKQNKLDKRERQCMDTLSDVLKMCYDECERVADSQMAKLKKDILFLSTHSKHQDVPESVEHGLVEAQSSSALFTTKAVVDIVTANLLQEKQFKEAVTLLPEYITRCIEVCWGMVARQPRMVLKWPDISQAKNIDMFTLFDGPGDTLGFVVWPALLLHKSGPLMSKGVLKAR